MPPSRGKRKAADGVAAPAVSAAVLQLVNERLSAIDAAVEERCEAILAAADDAVAQLMQELRVRLASMPTKVRNMRYAEHAAAAAPARGDEDAAAAAVDSKLGALQAASEAAATAAPTTRSLRSRARAATAAEPRTVRATRARQPVPKFAAPPAAGDGEEEGGAPASPPAAQRPAAPAGGDATPGAPGAAAAAAPAQAAAEPGGGGDDAAHLRAQAKVDARLAAIGLAAGAATAARGGRTALRAPQPGEAFFSQNGSPLSMHPNVTRGRRRGAAAAAAGGAGGGWPLMTPAAGPAAAPPGATTLGCFTLISKQGGRAPGAAAATGRAGRSRAAAAGAGAAAAAGAAPAGAEGGTAMVIMTDDGASWTVDGGLDGVPASHRAEPPACSAMRSLLPPLPSVHAGAYPPGATLNGGRYVIERKLNKGATAVVYAALDKHTGLKVALKVRPRRPARSARPRGEVRAPTAPRARRPACPPPRARAAPQVVQCDTNKVPVSVVRREVTLSSSVAHENMVTLLDVFAEGMALIIVWELISGPDLLELLNEAGGRLGEAAAAFYFVQLLRGVLHIHATGFCHRDIKPERPPAGGGLSRRPRALPTCPARNDQLIDFGLSKHVDSVATLGIGTVDYMAPELVGTQVKQHHGGGARAPRGPAPLPHEAPPPALAGRAADLAGLDGVPGRLPPQPLAPGGGRGGGAVGRAAYGGEQVDAWAMGVLLFLLVSGTYPFEDPAQPNSLAATIQNVLAGRRRALPPHIGAGCRAVIAGLLHPDPAERTRAHKARPASRTRAAAAAAAAQDLAHDSWLRGAASSYAAQLGPIGECFDPANPAWILPHLHAAAAAEPPAPPVAPPVAAHAGAAPAGDGGGGGGGAGQGAPPAPAGRAQPAACSPDGSSDATEFMDTFDEQQQPPAAPRPELELARPRGGAALPAGRRGGLSRLADLVRRCI
ncbi:SRK2E [Scenedesmus sp. PABB004]|nr:SRK2E [Scenedesmus sp. PABB004]